MEKFHRGVDLGKTKLIIFKTRFIEDSLQPREIFYLFFCGPLVLIF